MPNYEYECTQCAHRFEVWQKVGEAAPACPECGSGVKKVFHAPRVIFKGSGFYVTDLRAEKEKAKGSSGAASGSRPDGDKAPSTDSATASSDTSKGDAAESSSAPSTSASASGAADSGSKPSPSGGSS